MSLTMRNSIMEDYLLTVRPVKLLTPLIYILPQLLKACSYELFQLDITKFLAKCDSVVTLLNAFRYYKRSESAMHVLHSNIFRVPGWQ